jgi:hypothetical protein
MDKLKFLQIVQNTGMLSPALRADLTDIAENYPYFQGVYALLSKLNENEESVNQAAIRTANRTVLKSFLLNEDKKKDKREIIANLDLHTDQVNAFEKFENLDEEETEIVESSELQEEEEEIIFSENDEFEDELLKEEVEDTSDDVLVEELEEPIQNSDIIEVEQEIIPEDPNFPVFDEPDYLKTEQELATEIKQEDTSKDIPEYKESSGGSFFDAISDEQFPEVNFENEEVDSKNTTNFFEQIEEGSYQEKVVEEEASNSEKTKIKSSSGEGIHISTTNIPVTEFPDVDFEEINEGEFDATAKIASNYGEEVQISTTNIPATEFDEVDFEEVNEENLTVKTKIPEINGKKTQNKVNTIKKNELSYTDYHLVAGEVLPPNTKNPVKKTGKSKDEIQYEDYHLTPSQKEVKIITPKTKTEGKAPKVEKDNKPTENFFDSF